MKIRTVLGYVLILSALFGTAALGNRGASVWSEAQLRQQRHVIILDPGHGGIDGGATSCTGVLESGINLEIGHRLRDLLNLLGYDTVMTRTTDISIYTEGNTIAAQKMSDLKERVRTVNERENAILISIHQNTFSDSRYAGPQVFCAASEGSRELGEALQNGLRIALSPSGKRSVKAGKGIYLLEHIQQPGVLVECGFLSNPREEALLRNPAYQKKLCAVIGISLSEYLANT